MICYDIADEKRLRKVAKILESYGIRVQYSFFQCEMPKSKLEEVKDKVLTVLNLREDSFFIYPLCENCSRKPIIDGTGFVIKISTFEIV